MQYNQPEDDSDLENYQAINIKLDRVIYLLLIALAIIIAVSY